MAIFRDNFETRYSDNLKRELYARGMTAYELAQDSEVSKSYIYKILSNENSNPSIQCLTALANALGCDITDLIT